MDKSNVNKIILVGNIGHDPELRYTTKGNAVTSLSLATTRDFKLSNGDRKEETCWHRATVWGKRAESCAQHLKKGNRVYIEGVLQAKSWTDKQGTAHKSSEILVETIKFLGGRAQAIESALAEPINITLEQ